ncbi:MAG: fatty acid desaturase [Oligoflexales bacterium]|nr:fatty acid desaturase [Oligoflexales bacterium]
MSIVRNKIDLLFFIYIVPLLAIPPYIAINFAYLSIAEIILIGFSYAILFHLYSNIYHVTAHQPFFYNNRANFLFESLLSVINTQTFSFYSRNHLEHHEEDHLKTQANYPSSRWKAISLNMVAKRPFVGISGDSSNIRFYRTKVALLSLLDAILFCSGTQGLLVSAYYRIFKPKFTSGLPSRPDINTPPKYRSWGRYKSEPNVHFVDCSNTNMFVNFFYFEMVILNAANARSRAKEVYFHNLLLFLYLGSIAFLSWKTLVFFLIPFRYFLTEFIQSCTEVASHQGCDLASRKSNSASCYSKIYNILTFNAGYHLEHHYIASEHWSKLPEVRNKMPDEKHRRIIPYALPFGPFYPLKAILNKDSFFSLCVDLKIRVVQNPLNSSVDVELKTVLNSKELIYFDNKIEAIDQTFVPLIKMLDNSNLTDPDSRIFSVREILEKYPQNEHTSVLSFLEDSLESRIITVVFPKFAVQVGKHAA